MAFTAKDVKDLREKTGCGMMDCKKALTEADGDMEKAIELLREKGLAAQQKKSGRIAADGLVTTMVDKEKKVAAIIEVNSETDFVAKNAEFQSFVEACAKAVIDNNPADVDALLATTLPSGMTVEATLQELTLKIGEKMTVRRFARHEGPVACYIHGGGRIGVMVTFDTDCAEKDGFDEFGKDVAMQVAAAMPTYNKREDVPAEIIAKEKEILLQQAVNEGKPEAIAQKMVEGRINKFYKENCLVEQEFIKDNSLTVKKYADQKAKELGGKIDITGFVRFEKGEGMQKREDDFAAEVAAMSK